MMDDGFASLIDDGEKRTAHALFFDLDGTLHDRNSTVQRWLVQHTQRFEVPESYAPRFVELDDFGYRDKALVFPQLVEELGLKHDPAALLADFYASAFASPVPMPFMVEVLQTLRGRGLKLGIVTNGKVDQQKATLQGLGLLPLVDDVVISQEVGLSKPHPRIYQLALERLGLEAAQSWFVGDSPRNDIWGPQQVGMKAAFLPTAHALAGEQPDAVLQDLRGVLRLL